MRLINLHAIVPDNLVGQRLDQVLAQLFPSYSRAKLQAWIKADYILVDGKIIKAKTHLHGGETINIQAKIIEQTIHQAQAINLDIIYEDEHIIIINKPAGLVMHPAAGNTDGTLLNALLHHDQQLKQLPRAGIIHRLDKDTSGLLVVARNLQAHTQLVKQLQKRLVKRDYIALVHGNLISGGRIATDIGRHPTQRKQMAVVTSGKPAVTHYRIRQHFAHFTLLDVTLETGRTHQIRVHMLHIGHPIVGDPVYKKRHKTLADAKLDTAIRCFPRQVLHAWQLGLIHPITKEFCQWHIDLPDDIQMLLHTLNEYDINT